MGVRDIDSTQSAQPIHTNRRHRSLGSRSFFFLRDILQRPGGLIGTVLMVALIITAVFAPLIAPYDPIGQDIPNRLSGPTGSYWLGTDHLGRDLLSRILFGARISLTVAVPSVCLGLSFGLILGLAAGYIGGVIDLVVVTVADAIQAFPGIVLALAIIAILDPSLTNLILVIAFAFAPGYMRISRALVFNMKNRPFIAAEEALGARTAYIILRHVFPNVVPPILVLIAINLSQAIIIEAGLSFLGLGVRPPTPSWGIMLADGFEYIRQSPWGVIWSGLALMIATFGFTMVGETLRDIVDPRMASQQRFRQL